MPMKPTIKTNLKIMNHVLTCVCFLFLSLPGMKCVATNSLRGCVETFGKVPIVAFNKTLQVHMYRYLSKMISNTITDNKNYCCNFYKLACK